MAKFLYTFRRYEKKYLITGEQLDALTSAVADRVHPDQYGETQICNLYYDTPDYRLIRRSLEKPTYKEKLRVRCYGIPTKETVAFIEIKKKLQRVVFKRRMDLTYAEAVEYLKSGSTTKTGQIKNELDWFIKSYPGLAPSTALFYRRQAFIGNDDPELRLTVDRELFWRRQELDLTLGAYGEALLPEGYYLLEIKIPGAMPLWLAHILSELKIFPASYSKYGKAFLSFIKEISIFGGKTDVR